jgi:hypothetical protein
MATSKLTHQKKTFKSVPGFDSVRRNKELIEGPGFQYLHDRYENSTKRPGAEKNMHPVECRPGPYVAKER